MSSFKEKSGGKAKIRITELDQLTFAPIGSPVLYNIKKWSVKDHVETGDTTNTESETTPGNAVAKEEIGVSGQCTVSITQASFDPSINLFETPIPLTPNTVIQLELFPNDIESVPYVFPKLLLKDRNWEGEAGGLQPVTLEGVSIGTWTEPV